jgi:nucleotide-binding universal stress UspA family protein
VALRSSCRSRRSWVSRISRDRGQRKGDLMEPFKSILVDVGAPQPAGTVIRRPALRSSDDPLPRRARRRHSRVRCRAGVELVVMGTVARAGIAGFLIGNTAERVLGKLPCSVLAKPDGFVCPVSLDSV